MSATRPLVLNVDDVTLGWTSQHGERFEARLGGVGSVLGLRKLGCMLHAVPPGKRAFPVHRHHGVDELFLVLSGRGEYHADGTVLPIRPGDFLAAPAGGPMHQIVNTGETELRYVGVSSLNDCDVVEYPDAGKIGVMAGMIDGDPSTASYSARGRLASADYWDGE
jgi:uncharacterized cupin superfamily protein